MDNARMSRRRALRTLLLVGFVSFMASGACAAPDGNLVQMLQRYGIRLSEVAPFDDGQSRQTCGFGSSSSGRTYFTTDRGRASGVFSSDRTSATELVFEDTGTADVLCIAEAEVKNLTFEESAIVSSEVTVIGVKSPERPEFDISAAGSFQYDWKTVNSEISFEVQVDQQGNEIGRIGVWTALNGIDFIKLQLTPPNQSQTGLNDLLAAGLSGLQIEFVDRGLVELALQEEETKTGKTPRTARREAYTALEQYRSVLDPENLTVIGKTFRVFQDTILDGGGGKITVEPQRDIKFFEFLNDQTLINLIPELNVSAERIP